jgi:P-type Ca2+ transporter type 2C
VVSSSLDRDINSKTPDPDAASSNGKEKSKKPSKKGSQEQEYVELEQGADLDPAPFHSKPHALAHLLDPKDLDELENMGGVDAVLIGLGTDKIQGLAPE